MALTLRQMPEIDFGTKPLIIILPIHRDADDRRLYFSQCALGDGHG